MPIRASVSALAAVALISLTSFAAAQQSITIRAGTVLDGRGGVQRNAVVTVEGSRIVRVGDSAAASATYDFPMFTVLPGMIDTHVHIGAHFGKDGRASNAGETPAEQALAGAENAYAILMAGFTTV
jgi:imidazolonepropionase-like amidohydrolase